MQDYKQTQHLTSSVAKTTLGVETSSHIRKHKLSNEIPPSLKGRKSMRSLDKERVMIAFKKMTGNQALKFLHPRRLRNAILEKRVPTGTYEPQG